jgi:DNA-binding MarR family transcriptional regulator
MNEQPAAPPPKSSGALEQPAPSGKQGPSGGPLGPPFVHDALSGYTGFLLSRMGMVSMKQFAEHLEPLGITTRLWGALNVLEAEGPMTQHALGACVGIDPSSMVATIDELEAKGLVERRPHPNDRRAHALHLTRRGRQTLVRGRDIARVAHEELLAPLSDEERKTLHDLLLRLALATQAVRSAPPRPGKGARAGAGAP